MKLQRRLLNQFINLFWTILSFLPLIIYWYRAHSLFFVILFVVLSVIGIFMPPAFFRRLQLSRKRSFYRRLGIKVVRKLVQDGDLVNKFAVTRADRGPIARRAHFRRYLQNSLVYERFHFGGFIFFGTTSLHALGHRDYVDAGIITLINIFYNVYPILLQQFNRIRINGLLK